MASRFVLLFVKQGSHSLAYKKIQDSSRTFQDSQNVFPGLWRSPATLNCKQPILTLYIRCDSTIHHKTFITSCKETVQLAHSRNTSYIYLHSVFYKACWLSWITGKFQDFLGPTSVSRTFQHQTHFQHFPGPENFRKKIRTFQKVGTLVKLLNWLPYMRYSVVQMSM